LATRTPSGGGPNGALIAALAAAVVGSNYPA
jgi:hypothetical protein